MLLQCPRAAEKLLNDARTMLVKFCSILLETPIDQILHQ